MFVARIELQQQRVLTDGHCVDDLVFEAGIRSVGSDPALAGNNHYVTSMSRNSFCTRARIISASSRY